MPKHYTTFIGKTVKRIATLRGGGGSALPGLVIERIDKKYVPTILGQLPKGVVVVSGTNGKTTTTKMVVELLESQGLKVFTNKTGSNFVRGIAAALVSEVDLRGRLKADIAVLELDEAHGVQFVKYVKPRYTLLLNVMRDQLDRFGEIDTTANMLQEIAQATTEKVVVNREDPRLCTIGESLPKNKRVYFGLSDPLRSIFLNDDSMRTGTTTKLRQNLPVANGTLTDVQDNTVHFTLGGKKYTSTLQLDGVYNAYNAIAALTLVETLCGEFMDHKALLKSLSAVTPAFGRGEKIIVNNTPLELVLVKNPGGFRLGLSSFPASGYSTMIAINDNYADGRDMSWLWDVDFHSLRGSGVDMISGIRAYDMAVRLQYDEVEIDTIEPNLTQALAQFISSSTQPKRIYCTYTAMLALRRELNKITKVEKIL